mgnify:CR=1 FL=1
MANLQITSRWTESVRQIEPGDSVIGGNNAPINLCLGNLADRTQYLHEQITNINNVAVTLAGNQDIAGIKAFTQLAKYYATSKFANTKADFDAGRTLTAGADSIGAYIKNDKTNKSLYITDDNKIKYDNQELYQSGPKHTCLLYTSPSPRD